MLRNFIFPSFFGEKSIITRKLPLRSLLPLSHYFLTLSRLPAETRKSSQIGESALMIPRKRRKHQSLQLKFLLKIIPLVRDYLGGRIILGSKWILCWGMKFIDIFELDNKGWRLSDQSIQKWLYRSDFVRPVNKIATIIFGRSQKKSIFDNIKW